MPETVYRTPELAQAAREAAEAEARAARIAVRRTDALTRAIIRNAERRAHFAALPPLAEDARIFTYESAARAVRSGTSGFNTLQQEWIIGRMVSHGDCLWHATWFTVGQPGSDCNCGPCTDEREGR